MSHDRSSSSVPPRPTKRNSGKPQASLSVAQATATTLHFMTDVVGAAPNTRRRRTTVARLILTGVLLTTTACGFWQRAVTTPLTHANAHHTARRQRAGRDPPPDAQACHLPGEAL
jgi:hypothetical protein